MSDTNHFQTRPFKSIEDQLKLLEERGLDSTSSLNLNSKNLLFSNYYSLINGYKDPFLIKTSSGTDDQYTTDTSFEDIYNLYLFDRELRHIYFKYLLEFEESLKSVLAHRFSEDFKEYPEAYLNIKSYNHIEKRSSVIYRTIQNLSNEIYKQCSNSKGRNYIKHYKEIHEYVPMWVLIKSLSIGNVSHVYELLKNPLKDKISKDFSMRFKNIYVHDEKVNTNYNLTSKHLGDIIKIVNFFRNVCAHSEVLYLYKLDKPISENLARYFNQNITNSNIQKSNLFSLTCVLKLVLEYDDYENMLEKLNELIDEYSQKITSIDFASAILDKMGFPTNWVDLV